MKVCHGRKILRTAALHEDNWSALHPAIFPGKECHPLVRVLDKSYRLSGCSDQLKKKSLPCCVQTPVCGQ